MKKLLLLLNFLLTGIFAYPQITFERTYGGTGIDCGNAVRQTADGGFIIAGFTASFGAGTNDVYLVKTDSAGDTVFCRTYGGTDLDVASSVAQTFDHGYIIAGSTRSYGINGSDVYIIKTNENGDTVWTRTINSEVMDLGRSVCQTFDSGYVITGYRYNNNASNFDLVLIKTDAGGNTEWIKVYDWTNNETGNSVAQTRDSGLIITGMTYTAHNGFDVFLLKTNSDGDSLWARTYGHVNTDRGNAVIETWEGGYVVAGTTGVDIINPDIYIIKTDILGDTLWTRSFGGTANDQGNAIAETEDTGLIIAGTTYSYGHGYADVYLIRTTKNGDTLWTRSFGGDDFELGYGLSATSGNGIIIVGETSSFGAGNKDVYLIKTDSNGVSDGDLGIDSELLTPADEMNFFPNPTTGKADIKISKQFGTIKNLAIYDCMGQLKMVKTGNLLDIDISSLPDGLYFIILTNPDNEKLAGKIIKM